MSRKRRTNWKRLSTIALVAAGATATVAIAQTAGGLGGAGGPVRQAEERCTRFASLSLAAGQGIRQGRVEQVANGRMVVVGRLKGTAVKMTLENEVGDCRIVRIETL